MASSTLVLHHRPPLRPSTVLRTRGRVLILVAAFVALAVGAYVGDSGLLAWDEPVRAFVSTHRPDFLVGFFQSATKLGTLTSVVVGVTLTALLIRRRCYLVAGMLGGAIVLLPLLQWALKALIDRDRPAEDQLAHAGSPSFPSGHTMTAVVIWGLVPPVVALLTNRRVWWWLATVLSGTIIVIVAASRVYLGVHWISDVVGSALVGALILLLVERVIDLGHRHRPCPSCPPKPDHLARR